MAGVFISYRRDDTDIAAGRLSDDLSKIFGAGSIFRDIDSLDPGVDYEQALDGALSSCVVLIAVIGSRWLDLTDRAGRRRLEDPQDWVRAEIESALKRGIRVLPVLVSGAAMPREEEVPLGLRPLLKRQALELDDRHWKQDLELLTQTLGKIPGIAENAPIPPLLGGGEGKVKLDAIANSMTLSDGSLGQTRKATPTPTLLQRIRLWTGTHPNYFLAATLPPLGFATGHLVRLPVAAEDTQNFILFATVALSLLALWAGNRASAILVSATVGLALASKPLVVPIEGFIRGQTYPYASATAREYWLPGALLLILAVAITVVSQLPRLGSDLTILRPNPQAAGIACIAALAGGWYFSQPTVYDVYLPFRASYQRLREHLKGLAPAVDRLKEPFAPRRALDRPLVLDENHEHVRSEDPSTTGHFFLYQHLSDPDTYFGDIEYAFDDNLHLNIRDTGLDPVLYQPAFAQFATNIEMDRTCLERVVDAPYVVIVKPLRMDASRRVDTADIARAAPYRVLLADLKRDEIVFAADVETPGETFAELKAAVNATLQQSVSAKILQ